MLVTQEWNPIKKWNPFNSFKCLTQVERWKKIQRGANIPVPIVISLDPSNHCNLNCVWCNAKHVRRKGGYLKEEILTKLADFLPEWGVETICIAGGGEPFLNSHTGEFIERLLFNGIQVGVVTNGVLMSDFTESLSHVNWVGVSIDSAIEETYNKYKGSTELGTFDKVIKNIISLIEYSKEKGSGLTDFSPSHGVTFKFLLYENNIKEVYLAARLAKLMGCKSIHFRPVGTPWNRLEKDRITFSQEDVEEFREQIRMAMELDDEHFSVYGITHKFTSQFGVANYFPECYAVFMSAVIMPPTQGDGFNLELCNDRRGDSRVRLLENCDDVEEIGRVWGKEKHWEIHDKIKVEDCPRCTFQPHNEIYEYVIKQDSMSYKFI